MDLGAFAEEVIDAVAGICGDAIVETHAQAAHVLEALCRRPGANQREVAAVFGLSLEQFARSRDVTRMRDSGEEAKIQREDPVWHDICVSDAIYTWNVLIERINQAAHWREEFRGMVMSVENGDDSSSDEEGGDCDPEARETQNQEVVSAAPESQMALASAQTRQKARELFARHLEPAPELMRRRLSQRLDDEIFERNPDDKEYRHQARGLVANLRRNQMLAAGYATGRVPPQWLVTAEHEALAARGKQFQRRVERITCAKEAKHDDESAALRRKMWGMAKGTDLAPPPPLEDPTGGPVRPV